MKSNIIQTAEEKYLFGLSRAVWRTISIIIAIGLLLSILLTIWSLLPVAKEEVVKVPYPKEVEVSATDLANFIKSQEEEPTEEADSPNITEPDREFGTPDSVVEPAGDKIAFLKSLERARILAEELKVPWEPVGEYYYPYGEENYRRYPGENTRRYVEKSKGLAAELRVAFNKCNAVTSKDKKMLLDTLICLVNAVPQYRKGDFLQGGGFFWDNNVDESLKKTDVFRRILVQQDSIGFRLVLDDAAVFIQRNPADGVPFLLMADTMISKVEITKRPQFFKTMVTGFNWWFDGKVEDQARITHSFVTRVKELGDTIPGQRLMAFYNLYMMKNRQRETSIDSIEAVFAEQTMQAEAEYIAKNATDKERLWLALYGLGAGLILIAFVALILVLLSIHKYIKKLDGTIEKLASERNPQPESN